jgi:hypothetical protein
MTAIQAIKAKASAACEQSLVAGLLLAIVYVISGKLGLMLALPPG